MSKTQSTFADFEADDASDESTSSHSVDTDADALSNQPTDDTEQDDVEILPELLAEEEADCKCLNCENPVSEEYARVAGDNDGNVHSCPNCSTVHENLRGATAGVERDDGEKLFRRLQRGDER